MVLRSVQVVPQLVADPHAKLPAQGLEVLAGMQVPLPLQVLAAVKVEPLQLALPQAMPDPVMRQAPLPLQVPSWPQLLAAPTAHSLSGSVPTCTPRQRPLVLPVLALEQAMHRPGQLFSQHTPSTQAPEVHWLAVVQVVPLPFLTVQTPPEQKSPAMQSVSAAQVVLQAVAEAHSRLLAQEPVAPAPQVPMLHVPAPTVVVPVLPLWLVQLGEPQLEVGQTHWPLVEAAQLPLQAAVEPPQPVWPRWGPSATVVQVPGDDETSQASQDPVQARSQQ